MAQQVKMCATKLEDPGLIPRLVSALTMEMRSPDLDQGKQRELGEVKGFSVLRSLVRQYNRLSRTFYNP